MKKIIAISVMFVLIAAAAFADTTVSGAVETRFSLARQTGADGDDPRISGELGTAYVNLTGANSDGTLGGTFRLRGQDVWRKDNENSWNPDGGGAWVHKAFVWWKPIDQVKIFLGIENDGLFDTTDFLGWGFHSGDNDYLFNHHWDYWRMIFPGNWDGYGLALSVYPMPGLDINLVLPTGKVGWPQATKSAVNRSYPLTDPDSDHKNAGMIPGRLRLSGNFSADFGKISFAYLGGGVVAEKGNAIGEGIGSNNNGLFGLSALITAIDSVQIKVGGSILLNDKNKDGVENVIYGGFGVGYTGDGFGVKVRVGLTMQKGNYNDSPFITANILPFLAVGEKGQFLFDIGITKVDDLMGWSVIPAYRLNIDGGAFKIGFQIFTNNLNVGGGNINVTAKNEYIKWNIPMLLFFVF